MKKPLIILLASMGILSCHKDSSLPPPAGWDWFGSHDEPVYNYVLLSGNQVTNQLDSNDYQISVAAAFIDSNSNKLQGVSDLVINSRPIFKSSDNTYTFNYENTPYFQEGLSLFGRLVSIRIKGFSELDTVTASVYLPKKVLRGLADLPVTVDRTQALNLHWQSDELNHWGNLIIQVYYYPVLSQGRDSTLPTEIKALNYTVPDTGAYTIDAADLERFPAGAVIGISVARGTQTVALLPKSLRRIFFFTSSSASTPPLVVSAGKEP